MPLLAPTTTSSRTSLINPIYPLRFLPISDRRPASARRLELTGFKMGHHSDDEYSVAGDKPEVEFMDFQNDNTLQDYQSDDGPVVVTAPFPFVNGKPKSVLGGETSTDTICIAHPSCEPVNVWSVRIFSSNPAESYGLSMMKPPLNDADEAAKKAFLGLTSVEDRTLQPGQTLTIWLSCMPKDIGLHTSIVHVDIGDEKIERVAFLLAMIMFQWYLLLNLIPGDKALKGSNLSVLHLCQRPDVLSEELSMMNYAKFFSTLLVMEELNLEEEMRSYDMERVSMRRRGNDYLSLVVPGLAEKRPSLVHGDYIIARHAGSDARPYQGYIHKVEADEIFLRFDDQFHHAHHDRNKYDVSFTYNRLNMRRQYRSVHDAELIGPDVLFPPYPRYRSVKKVPFKPLNPNINTEQADAVGMILGCRGVTPS
ncbi:hypothetical protein ZWY2020_019697 [Hordeum vulgare]|nr:hypothetical protein ZWY2020_019697 [Hordeum vulgare]